MQISSRLSRPTPQGETEQAKRSLPVALPIIKTPYDISSSRLLIFIKKKPVVFMRVTTYADIQTSIPALRTCRISTLELLKCILRCDDRIPVKGEQRAFFNRTDRNLSFVTAACRVIRHQARSARRMVRCVQVSGQQEPGIRIHAGRLR